MRRGLALWLRETSDIVEAVEKRIKSRPHGNFASSAVAKNLECASAEGVHCEARLKELNQTCEFLTRLLEARNMLFTYIHISNEIVILKLGIRTVMAIKYWSSSIVCILVH